jgi:hypothetical protein
VTALPLCFSLWAPRTFLGDRYRPFLLFSGSKNLSWRPQLTFFVLYGLQEPFLATATNLFYSFRAPRTFLGDRNLPFLLFTGSKNLSWRPLQTFFTLCGLQEPSLATATYLFYSLRAPRTFLGDRYKHFLLFVGSKNLSWRPLQTFFAHYGLLELSLATATHLFFLVCSAPRTKKNEHP